MCSAWKETEASHAQIMRGDAMRYRRGWNGMTEIVWEEGNLALEPKVLQYENMRPRKKEPVKVASARRRRKEKKRADRIRIMTASVMFCISMVLIAMLDGATILQTLVILPAIFGILALIIRIMTGIEDEP